MSTLDDSTGFSAKQQELRARIERSRTNVLPVSTTNEVNDGAAAAFLAGETCHFNHMNGQPDDSMGLDKTSPLDKAYKSALSIARSQRNLAP